MKVRSCTIADISSLLTVIISFSIAVFIPAAHFIIDYKYMVGSLKTEMAFSARAVEALVVNNPHSWQFEEVRLQEILERRLDDSYHDNRAIRDLQGRLIAETKKRQSRPAVTFTLGIYDSGVEVARLEFERSITTIVARTAFIGMCSALLGITIFLFFRFFPLRTVRQAYDKLQENEHRLMLALKCGHFGVLDWDIEKNVMLWDDRLCEIYGVSRDGATISLETWKQYIHGEDRGKFLEAITSASIVQKGFDTEFRIVQPRGAIRYIKTKGQVVADDKGKPSRLISVSHDITELKEAEAERNKLIASLSEALENIKTLKGLIPICAACKRIRNDAGYWEQIENYICNHSNAEFSHSICPECARNLYPEFYPKTGE